jgi:uncharacterized caspase-like protein
MRWLVCLLAVLCIGSSPFAQSAPRRVALLIGNSHYSGAIQLTNPGSDVQLVAEAARSAGFQIVVVKNDLGMTDFQHALRDFRAQADGAQVAMVYYAGHGIEGSGSNWLIPTDATLASERDLSFEAINLNQVVDVLAGAQFRVVILDACRNNPFGRQWTSGSRAVTRGLAPVQLDDVMVIYAAAPGQTASDGSGAHSPFATAFARHFADSGLALQLLGGVVRDDVAQATNGEQRPYVSASITGTAFYLVPPHSIGATAGAEEINAFLNAVRGGTASDYRQFADRFPTGMHHVVANDTLALMQDEANGTTWSSPPEK